MGDPALRIDSVGLQPAAGRALAEWLARVAPARARGAVTVAVTTDARVRALNGRFRRVHQATDVLSFPAGERGVLGDIVIAEGVARRQAKAAGHPVATELKILALHGLLHLLGYDHETDAGQMARAEARLRRKGGLENGLIERSRRQPAPGVPGRRSRR